MPIEDDLLPEETPSPEVDDELEQDDIEQGDEDAGSEQETEPAESAEPARKENRYQRLANERRAERERAELERRARENAENEARLLRDRLAALERERVAREEDNLDPDERWRRDANRAITETRMLAADMADKAEFVARYASFPGFENYREKVEARMNELRRQGYTPVRDVVFKVIFAEEKIEAEKKSAQIKSAAKDRVRQQRGTPLGSKSNVGKTTREQSLADRLKDIPL